MKNCKNCKHYDKNNKIWACDKEVWIADITRYWCTEYEPSKKYYNKMNHLVLSN
jgi:hypothetical protein